MWDGEISMVLCAHEVSYDSQFRLRVWSETSVTMKRRAEDRIPCRICKKKNGKVWTCELCESQVCRTHLYWCGRAECNFSICQHCQSYSSSSIQRVVPTKWFCEKHLSLVCITCASEDVFVDCSRCPLRMCWRHALRCDNKDCDYALCKECRRDECLKLIRTKDGSFCENCV